MNNRKIGFSAVAVLAITAVAITTGCQNFTAQALNAEGVRRMNKGETEQAETYFLKARSSSPSDADACYNLAIVEHQKALKSNSADDFQQAEQYYKLCLDRNPSHAEAYRGLATLYCDEKKPDEAFALLENWNRQEIGSVEPKIELARLYNEYNRIDQAEQTLHQALAIDPKNVRALNSMGYVYEQKCQYAEASKLYCQSLQIMPAQTGIAQRRAELVKQIPNSCGSGSSQLAQTPISIGPPPTGNSAPLETPAWSPASVNPPVAGNSNSVLENTNPDNNSVNNNSANPAPSAGTGESVQWSGNSSNSVPQTYAQEESESVSETPVTAVVASDSSDDSLPGKPLPAPSPEKPELLY